MAGSSCVTPAESIEIFTGMTKAGETSYEVWVHEDCALWASGVYFVGVRIVGLESAVWSSTRHKCTICTNYGAMMCCLQRGCDDQVHVPCARSQNWTLNNLDFKSRCEKHSTTIATTTVVGTGGGIATTTMAAAATLTAAMTTTMTSATVAVVPSS